MKAVIFSRDLGVKFMNGNLPKEDELRVKINKTWELGKPENLANFMAELDFIIEIRMSEENADDIATGSKLVRFENW